MPTILFVIILLFSSLVSADDHNYITDRLDWQKIIKNNATINITNLYGNVHIKKSQNHTFFAHAVAQNHQDRSEKAKLINQHENDQIDLTVAFNSEVIEKERVDLTILVPKHVSLNVTMKGGKLHGKKLNFPLTVKGDSTSIQLSTNHAFDLFSKTGLINIKLNDKLSKQSSSVQTHKSNVVIQYGTTIPYFDVISGLDVVSNSSTLISSKKQQRRHKLFNDPQSPAKISVVSDVGRVILLQ